MTEKKTKIKVAPHSKESEMMVLGCMLTSPDSLNVAADALDDSDFYFSEHKILFQVLKNAYKKDKPSDIHLVCEELKRIEKLDDIGGVAYVATLAQYVGTSAYIEQYVEIVKAKSILRKMIVAAEVVEKRALDEPEDVREALDEAQNLFFKISQSANPGAGVLITDLLSGLKGDSQIPFLKILQERQELFRVKGPQELAITGHATHFLDLDRIINGLNNSHLIIVAARPAMGKTAFALNIAESVCFKNKAPVGIFSLEMTAEQLLYRIITSQAEVESDKIRTGALSGIEFQRIVSAVADMQKYTMVIDDQPGLKITDLRARARRMKEAYGIKLLIIDYLQLISGSSTRIQDRQNEISEISRMLKTLARELDIPIICLSQLSRKVEDRAGHRPLMSDLRESGCLTGDTIIEDANTGSLHTIKDLAERKEQTPFFVHSLDHDLKLTKQKLIKAFYSGKKLTFSLTTKSGRTIKASGNHPFYKLEGWTRLDALKVGDKIAIPRSLNVDTKDSLTEDEIVLMAHLLGDGCILPNQPYHYTSQDEANLDLVGKASERLFNIHPRLVKQKSWYHLYLPSPFQLTKGKFHPITIWFQKLGLNRVRAPEKKIPVSVFKCSNNKIALFLHHLWGTDGNISPKLIKGRSPAAAIYYGSTSKILSQQVQHLLLRLGIQSSLKVSHSAKGARDMHNVHIQGTIQQTAFLKTINSSGNRGLKAKQLLKDLSSITPNPNNDVIPQEAWNLFITPAKEKARLSWRQFAIQLGMSYCGSTLFKHGISRERLLRINQFLNDKKLNELAHSDIYWDEIVEIKELDTEDVYDATVENTHNFVANDIIVHNSIEQDSDIVIFLLRREYYDPNDKPGMAEVIIAKNRHGGIGNVNLTYVKEFAQFRNYTPAEITLEEDSFASL